ncbi:acetyltransferase [Rhizobium sp. WSM1325]|uniref:acetyltransferase n=1 Tax=Rhizobium sp. WSM1325 TaxID=3444086 RepID=UPI000FEF778C|nr:acetyltransferase [Rhizobium leguminosarum]RWY67656.1 acetyltransferase [Rhizobium leguminosarum]
MFNAFGIGPPSLGPDDVTMVQSPVREHCRTNAIKPDSEEAHDLARELRKWFQAGVTDRNRLRKLLASPD